MKYLQFVYKNRPNDIRLGYVEGRCVVDVHATEQYIPKTMLEFLEDVKYLKMLGELKDKHPTCTNVLNEVIIKAPIYGVDKIICVDLNYLDYCERHNAEPTPEPIFFNKFASTIIGPNEAVKIRSDVTKQMDWQVGLGVVMSRNASVVKEADALKHVFGFTIAQDITARDWSKDTNGGQSLLGKSMDTSCPLGPWIVTLDEIEDLGNLEIKCMLNGVYKQKCNTNNCIHTIPKIIERISSLMTLLPGDIIITGTPGGVGMFNNPPEFLKPGDILRSEIEKIGYIETRFEQYIKPQEVFFM